MDKGYRRDICYGVNLRLHISLCGAAGFPESKYALTGALASTVDANIRTAPSQEFYYPMTGAPISTVATNFRGRGPGVQIVIDRRVCLDSGADFSRPGIRNPITH